MTTTQTTQLMTWATEYKDIIDSGGSFLAEQSPLVVEEMLFAPWLQLGYISFFLTVSLCVFFITRCRTGGFSDGATPVFSDLVLMLSGVASGFLSIGFFISLKIALQAHFTPRLYIMEQLAGMVM